MTEETQPEAPDEGTAPAAAARRPRSRRAAPRWWSGPVRLFAVFASVTIAVVFGGLALTGRPLSAPDWVVRQVEERANLALAGQARVSVGGIDGIIDADFVPRIRMTGLTLFAPSGARLAVLPEVRAIFDPAALIVGRIEPTTMRVTGASIALRRLPDGSLDIPQTGGSLTLPEALSPTEMLDAVKGAFDAPGLAGLRRIEVSDLDIVFEDARAGQRLAVDKGALTLEQDDDLLRFRLGVGLSAPGAPPGRADLSFATRKRSHWAELRAEVAGIPAQVLAAQSPGFAWLRPLDAPISGTFRSGIAEDGRVGRLSATLDIGRGALRPNPEAAPASFERARIAMDYDPERGELTLDGLEVDSATLRTRGSARAWLKGLDRGFPTALVGQVALSEIKADPAGLFDAPLELTRGALDFKLSFEPFSVEIGQLALSDDETRVVANGSASAGNGGWTIAMDLSADRITTGRVLALWPVQFLPRTRDWFAANVIAGNLSDLRGAVRVAPGEDPRFALGYDFQDAEVRVIRTLPPIRNGAGHSTIQDNAYTVVLDTGTMSAGEGGAIDAAGSVLTIPDIRKKPADAEIRLVTDSTLRAALWMLDQPPFRFLTKAGQPVDVAGGRARTVADLSFALDGVIGPGDVTFAVDGEILDASSAKLFPGHPIEADRLTVRATNAGIEIAGDGTVSGVGFRGSWRQDFGPGTSGRSRLVGGIELSRRFLDAFSIALPDDMLRGEGVADLSLDFARGTPPRFELVSTLERIAMSISGIGWAKPAAADGRLVVRGALGRPATVDTLELDAEGLRLDGKVVLTDDGRLERATFETARVGGWFDGSAEIRADGPGNLRLSVTGGSADMRRSRSGGAGGGMPFDVTLDSLRVSDGIALTGFRGEFSPRGGLNGTFSARVNGKAAITGTAAPTPNGTGFRIRSDDAGAVFAASGIFSRARGGTLETTLRPVGGPGEYDGSLKVIGIRVVDAPVLAELLGAISVVGLLEQLNGSGIVFSDVKGQFRVRPGAVEISQGSAVGASLGVSGAGIYDSSANTIDLRGTISPIYLFNGIGQIFSRQREGLFGFNYRLRGSASAPRITVNPLSILTPGVFREIFRSPPPTLSK